MVQVILAALFLFATVMCINAGTNFDATWTKICPNGMLTNILLLHIYTWSDLKLYFIVDYIEILVIIIL
jgi:hypothetical protein